MENLNIRWWTEKPIATGTCRWLIFFAIILIIAFIANGCSPVVIMGSENQVENTEMDSMEVDLLTIERAAPARPSPQETPPP